MKLTYEDVDNIEVVPGYFNSTCDHQGTWRLSLPHSSWTRLYDSRNEALCALGFAKYARDNFKDPSEVSFADYYHDSCKISGLSAMLVIMDMFSDHWPDEYRLVDTLRNLDLDVLEAIMSLVGY